MSENNIALFTDFDQTMITQPAPNKTTSDLIEEKILAWKKAHGFITPEQKQFIIQSIIAEQQMVGNKEEWQNLIIHALTNNIPIVIISFNKYCEAVKFFLQYHLQLPEKMIEQIHFSVKAPSSSEKDKNRRIQQVTKSISQTLGTRITKGIFLDDDPNMINAANGIGCKTILAQSNGNHIKQAMRALQTPDLLPELTTETKKPPSRLTKIPKFNLDENMEIENNENTSNLNSYSNDEDFLYTRPPSDGDRKKQHNSFFAKASRANPFNDITNAGPRPTPRKLIFD